MPQYKTEWPIEVPILDHNDISSSLWFPLYENFPDEDTRTLVTSVLGYVCNTFGVPTMPSTFPFRNRGLVRSAFIWNVTCAVLGYTENQTQHTLISASRVKETIYASRKLRPDSSLPRTSNTKRPRRSRS